MTNVIRIDVVEDSKVPEHLGQPLELSVVEGLHLIREQISNGVTLIHRSVSGREALVSPLVALANQVPVVDLLV